MIRLSVYLECNCTMIPVKIMTIKKWVFNNIIHILLSHQFKNKIIITSDKNLLPLIVSFVKYANLLFSDRSVNKQESHTM